MAKEIERKFVVKDDSFKEMASHHVEIAQCYLSTDKFATIRLRRLDNKGFITIKGITTGASRDEWEYEIPLSDAEEMVAKLTSGWAIEKTRYLVDYMGHRWEVDEFHGHLKGLILAEVELKSESTEVSLPPFIGEEVTGNPAYYNSELSKKNRSQS
ncbi:MAG: CYTH domain-containing protein [Lachnoclostridium sp.]|nr:CYTH domain-containing protein [Lachnoclostridium sp.]